MNKEIKLANKIGKFHGSVDYLLNYRLPNKLREFYENHRYWSSNPDLIEQLRKTSHFLFDTWIDQNDGRIPDAYLSLVEDAMSHGSSRSKAHAQALTQIVIGISTLPVSLTPQSFQNAVTELMTAPLLFACQMSVVTPAYVDEQKEAERDEGATPSAKPLPPGKGY